MLRCTIGGAPYWRRIAMRKTLARQLNELFKPWFDLLASMPPHVVHRTLMPF
jgi:hypothetical protein